MGGSNMGTSRMSGGNPARQKPARKLSTMIILLVMLVVVVCMSLTILLYVVNYNRLVYSNAETSSTQTAVQVRNTIALYCQEIDSMIELLKEEEHVADPYADRFLEVRPDIIDISAYDSNGEMIGCWAKDHTLRENLMENLSFDREMMKGEEGLTVPHVVTFFEGYYPWVVTRYVRLSGGNYIAVDFNFSNISNLINHVGIGQHGYCFLMTGSGDLVYHPQQQLIYSGLKSEDFEDLAHYGPGTYRDKTMIYSIQEVGFADWNVVGVSYVDELVSEARRGAQGYILITAFVIMMTAFIMSSVLTAKLSRPLRVLEEEMHRFEQDADGFEMRPVEGAAEVMQLSDSFAHMAGRTRQLMETIRQEEISLRKTELKALQAQINPHFLYNTLDSIYVMCQRGKNMEAGEMVIALSKLFRISISRGKELIPISSELEHAESYLRIQQFRFKNQFHYHFDVDENSTHYLCNKILLQPLLENSIIHGLNGLVDEGEITVRVFAQGEDILMQVEDNGCGMSPQRVQSLLEKDSSDRQGIGISNVNARLKIYFGDAYGLTVESEEDMGTVVTIRMPRVEKEDDYEKI